MASSAPLGPRTESGAPAAAILQLRVHRAVAALAEAALQLARRGEIALRCEKENVAEVLKIHTQKSRKMYK